MTPSDMARILGRKGGRARAARLSAREKSRIASLGGQARRESIVAARRIDANFGYLAAVHQLREPPAVTRERAPVRPLPTLRSAKT